LQIANCKLQIGFSAILISPMLHLRRYFAALAVLSLVCGTYWLAAAPLVEPPPLKARKPAAASSPVAISPHVQDELTRLFPTGAWELDPATKVVETDQCTLLIRDYLPTPDGLLKLNPCTLIFYAKGRAATEGQAAPRRPIVLQAPAGAVLEFDQALDLTRARFGRLLGGELPGEITISSPPTQPGGADSLLLKTRSVHLNRQEITTVHPVEFRYGNSHGRGQGLEIKMLNAEGGLDGQKKRAPLGGMQSLMLRRLECLRIETPGQGLLGEALNQPTAKGRAASEPLEIRCRGPFTFDVPAQVARFEEQVEVDRVLPGGPSDKLRCDELLLTLLLQSPPGAPPAGDPLAGRLQRLVALGSPATLEAPASGISASAAWMEFEIQNRRITLRPGKAPAGTQGVTQVSLRQHEQHFVARELQYELADEGRLGRMWAAGPGEIKLLQGRGAARQAITARWEKEMWVRPDEQHQVISLIAAASIIAEPAASIIAEPLGRFDADELHLWVLEVPAERPPPAIEPQSQPKADQPTAKQPRVTLVPHRLLAKGHVQLTSPQLDAQTGELRVWFLHRPPAAEAPRELPPAGPLREPVARTGFQQNVPLAGMPSGAIRNVIRPPNLQKFRVSGGTIQMQLAVQGRKFDLEDLTIEDQATIDETRTPEPGQEPIHVSGEMLQLLHGTTPEAKVEVSGRPAEVAGRGMRLSAGTIHVHRGENRMWIDGPGEATLPTPAEQALPILPQDGPRRPAPPGEPARPAQQKLHLVWHQRLNFDGETVRLEGEVQARTAMQTAAAPLLEAKLNQRVDMAAPSKGQQPQIARLHLDGGVYLTNRGENDLGEQISFDQMQVPNLTVDRTTGRLHADGPGWVSSVRRSSGLPGMPAAPGSEPAQPIGPPGLRPTSTQPLTSVHVAYAGALEGDLNKRQIQFQREVRTTYSPASDFSERIVVVQVADLTERAVLMTSERLTLTEMITPVQRWIEMQATGHAIMQGRTFHVNTPGRLSYTSATQMVTIEGDGRAPAEINYQPAPGEPFNPASVQKARYNIRTGEFDGEVKRLEFFIPGKGLKLPGR
jgi:hypothetical protein